MFTKEVKKELYAKIPFLSDDEIIALGKVLTIEFENKEELDKKMIEIVEKEVSKINTSVTV